MSVSDIFLALLALMALGELVFWICWLLNVGKQLNPHTKSGWDYLEEYHRGRRPERHREYPRREG